MVIPKWQAAREECDSKLGKSRDLEYIIKQKVFITVQKRMFRSTWIGAFIFPQKGNLRC